MSRCKRCEACDRKYKPDELTGELEPSCRCVECTACNKVFKLFDPRGPLVAPSERVAAMFGDSPRCVKCWAKLLKENK